MTLDIFEELNKETLINRSGMVYPYHCDRCGLNCEIQKPMSEASRPEKCKCGALLRRVYTAPSVTWGKNCWDFDHEGLGDDLVLKHHD